MPSFLSSVLAHTSRNQHLLLLQSSAAQSCLPVFRATVQDDSTRARETTVLVCLLNAPSTLLNQSRIQSDRIRVVDRTANVPGYDDTQPTEKDWISSLREEILDAIRSAPDGPLNVYIDSIDTLLSDIGSIAETTKLLSEALALVRSHGATSRLILHAVTPCPLIPILSQTRFSSSLTHLTAHPTALLTHLSTAYLTPPPPLSPEEKFWGVFIPFAERHYESEKLVFGQGGEGSGLPEFVVEVLVRGGSEGSGRRRGTDHVLEGWSPTAGGPCELCDLDSLRPLWAKKPTLEAEKPSDPTQNLSFNLNLTAEQQRSRAQVPLPYAHEGKPAEFKQTQAAILYDPDSADDLDDDDPDEDLDI